MARLVLSEAADRDLIEIGDFGIERWGVDRAATYVQTLQESFDLLLRHPFAGRARGEIAPDLRSLRHRSHIILYRVDGDSVIVARILHVAADPESSLL